ncbi:biotin/lipoyl-binding protein, partial [Mesorhizobium sp. M1050]|uniref:efflux RND transporter periplasmic adaptor subunit n=1 Tax=Mesorhizobium sp. M1050 TaxID=2957051 RepID=UPI00333D3CA2
MRGKVILSLLAVACVGAAWLYLSPDTLSRVQQLTGAKQVAAADKPATDKPTAGDKSAGGGSGARSASILSAVASTADFPIRRYAIGFVSSPAVVSINARVSSQIVSIDVKDGQMVRVGDVLFSLDDRALKAQLAKDQAALAKDQAMLASSQSDLQRAKDLVAKQAGTQQTYDQAVAPGEAAAGPVAGAHAPKDAAHRPPVGRFHHWRGPPDCGGWSR